MLMYKNYLFDLDGTLLPMDMEKFVKLYFSSLCKRCTPVIKIEPDALIKAMWAGTDAMTKNDNSRTNREVFWETAGKVSGADLEKFDDLFTDYYENEFIVPKDATSFTPYAKKSIDFIKKNGGRLIAATNPIFPFVATKRRLEWAGVSPDDFELVTTYENFGCCKPNLKYFEEICKKQDIKPIIGCEVYTAARTINDRDPEKDRMSGHLILLAENQKGYGNLVQIVSAGYVDGC